MNILFVCLGNICRSPTAEGVMRQRMEQAGLAAQVALDSAGTAAWHQGKPVDPRTRLAAQRRGYDLSLLRGRQVVVEDFHRFELILAMDANNLRDLQAMCPAHAPAEVDLYLRRYGLQPHEVPDPYYGGEEGFEQVLDLLEEAADRLLADIRGRL